MGMMMKVRGFNFHIVFSVVAVSLIFHSFQLNVSVEACGLARKLLEVTEVEAFSHDDEASKIVFGGGIRAVIGSKPPRCQRRCDTCVHCEAIQVPATPQNKKHAVLSTATTAVFGDTTNYKPMSWKCKCGDLIYNP